MAGMGDFAFSMQMRDTIAAMISEQLDSDRPKYRYATVKSIDRTNWKCTVRYNGDNADVIVNMGTIQPISTGQIVRVEGIGIDKFITDVIGGYAWNRTRWGTVDPYYTSGGVYVTWEGDALKSGPYGQVNGYVPKGGDTVIAIEIPNHSTMISPVINLINDTHSRMPNFYPLTLQNSWIEYQSDYGIHDNFGGQQIPTSVEAGGSFAIAAFTKTIDGIVKVKGMITSGTIAAGTVIAQLPVGFRPLDHCIFPAGVGGTWGSVDVNTDGTIVTRNSVASSWLSLDNITFPEASTAPLANWSIHGLTGVLQGAWQDFSDNTYGKPGHWVDPSGFVWSKGLITNSATVANDNPMFVSPAPMNGLYHHRPGVGSNQAPGGLYMRPDGTQAYFLLTGAPNPPGWFSLSGTPYMASTSPLGGYATFPEAGNGWGWYGGNYANPGYIKTRGNHVFLRGLVKTASGLGDGSMFKLPPGFRPRERLLWTGLSNSTPARLDIAPTGWVYAQTGVSGAWCSLDSINFIADQANVSSYGP